jgi:sugar/nucleoside kinase (ribokinase family)
MGPRPRIDGETLARLSGRMLDMGAAVVGIKLGECGLYLRTSSDRARLEAVGGALVADADAWRGRELCVPTFEVRVAGTTGAGDCAIAGFLAGMLHGLIPERTMRAAVGAGAACCERPDATSGVPGWDALEERIDAGWRQSASMPTLRGWTRDEKSGAWRGPNDTTMPKSESRNPKQ